MKSQGKPKDLVKRYSSAIVEALVSKVRASSPLDHRLTKGELRELFVTNVLASFLTRQFDVGTGIIINQKEDQSRQTDIVIYDNRILPPFIKEQHVGVYPAESVVGVIEVKSILDKKAILDSENSAKILHDSIYNPSSSFYRDYDKYPKPLCATVSFYGVGPKELAGSGNGKRWLERNVHYNFALCLIGKFSWIRLANKGWVKSANVTNYEETKRFIAVFVDNLRTLSELRLKYMAQLAHKDWIGIYIRDQKLFRNT